LLARNLMCEIRQPRSGEQSAGCWLWRTKQLVRQCIVLLLLDCRP